MSSSPAAYTIDDKDLDDAALWAVIDSAAAKASSLAAVSPQTTIPRHHRTTKPFTPIPFPVPSPKLQNYPRSSWSNLEHPSPDVGEVVQNTHRLNKALKTSSNSSPAVKYDQSTPSPPMAVVKHVTSFSTPDASSVRNEECGLPRHSLAGQFPTVSLFKDYQNAAMAILEKSDYTMISGHAFIKKSGWRKISFYFNVSYEIKDKTIEFDENRNVQRAEFIVRAFMQGGRFSDGWGSCERREKKFLKPNHDIPSTAETRAKNKACQDLLGIGEYRPGASHV